MMTHHHDERGEAVLAPGPASPPPGCLIDPDSDPMWKDPEDDDSSNDESSWCNDDGAMS